MKPGPMPAFWPMEKILAGRKGTLSKIIGQVYPNGSCPLSEKILNNQKVILS